MADIARIKLPNGTTYDIADSVARNATLTADYDESSEDLELMFSAATSADNEEF